MFRILITALLCLSGCSSLSKKETDQLPTELTQANVQSAVDQAVKDGNLPAISTYINVNGKVFYYRTQGKRSMQQAVLAQNGDKWHLGSDTKAMTAYLIAAAVTEGHIQYESNVAKILGKSVKPNKMNQNLTIADLLSHHSGLKDIQSLKNDALNKISKSGKNLTKQREEIVKAAFEEAPNLNKDNKPVRAFSYANINYIAAGVILEKIYKISWENLMRIKLFMPLNMNSCSYGVAGDELEEVPSQPWAHALENKVLIGVPPKYKADNPALIGPAGSVHCSLDDWAKFMTELINVWNKNSKLIKNQKVVEKYFETSKESFYTYGGWGRIKLKEYVVLTHSGSNTLNYATADIFPEKNTFFLVATNSGQTEAAKAIGKLTQTLEEMIVNTQPQ